MKYILLLMILANINTILFAQENHKKLWLTQPEMIPNISLPDNLYTLKKL